MKQLIIFIAFSFFTTALSSQTIFHHTVKIEFEKTVYVRQLYKEAIPRWYETIKARLPETTTTYFDFIGDSTKSIFKPGREVKQDPRMINEFAADKNQVYTDFKTGRLVAQKPVYEETFLVEDSLSKIKWKLTSDTRVIAGYECRKAVGILNDSIGVFAFYTDELMVNGGPESITGLPGMILGLGIPKIHATWFATKVEVTNINMNAVTPATKGKKVSTKTMAESLEKVFKNWGEEGKKLLVIYAI
jgi:GLPGLI family protein